MSQPLMNQGFDLMIYGMGTVFFFLTLLVIVTSFMSQIIQRYFAEQPVEELVSRSISRDQAEVVEPRVVAVIKAAIHEHRQKN